MYLRKVFFCVYVLATVWRFVSRKISQIFLFSVLLPLRHLFQTQVLEFCNILNIFVILVANIFRLTCHHVVLILSFKFFHIFFFFFCNSGISFWCKCVSGFCVLVRLLLWAWCYFAASIVVIIKRRRWKVMPNICFRWYKVNLTWLYFFDCTFVVLLIIWKKKLGHVEEKVLQ